MLHRHFFEPCWFFWFLLTQTDRQTDTLNPLLTLSKRSLLQEPESWARSKLIFWVCICFFICSPCLRQARPKYCRGLQCTVRIACGRRRPKYNCTVRIRTFLQRYQSYEIRAKNSLSVKKPPDFSEFLYNMSVSLANVLSVFYLSQTFFTKFKRFRR